ncbi:transcriptional regulator, TrmB [sediment metagenome]|uniref:Transcriptional regulator, TrmB n=1 Tax=sediment metagenome TaxID=749907 RepID=D9PL89_9ZZZZ
MDINNFLHQFGLSNKESDVYLACLELGSTTVNEISIKANIKRTTTYDVLASLIKQGLIIQTQKAKKRLFYAESPERLKKLLEEKLDKLNQVMPLLKSFCNTIQGKPKIMFYEGRDGLKKVYEDALNYPPEMLAIVTENVLTHLDKDFCDDYIKRRTRLNIRVRAIASENKEMSRYKSEDEKYIKQTKLVAADKFLFTIEMMIYGNKVAFISFKEKLGIIIESEDINNNMRAFFGLAWGEI